MTVRIKNKLRAKSTTTGIKTRFQALLTGLGLPEAEVSILLVGDRAMRTLNRTWRGKDQTTDVLSFPFRDRGTSRSLKKSAAGAPPELLGDIVVSIPVARRQAKEAGQGLGCELDRLLVHGLVHLLGYDHEKGAGEARRMRRKEQLLLNRLS